MLSRSFNRNRYESKSKLPVDSLQLPLSLHNWLAGRSLNGNSAGDTIYPYIPHFRAKPDSIFSVETGRGVNDLLPSLRVHPS